MIDLVLDKRFVLELADLVLRELEAPALKMEIEEEDEAARTEVATALGEAIASEPQVESLDLEKERPAEERKAYLPANRVLSMLQTALEEQLRQEYPDHLQPAPGTAGPGGPAVTALFIGAAGVLDKLKMAAHVVRAILRRWRIHGFVESTPPVTFDLASDARIVLVGDWGMGNASAQKVVQLIGGELAAAGDREAHLIHLGDVYYSGEKPEAQKHVLDLWPIKAGDANRWSWALNGNHDMYSGGFGYFDVILADGRFARQRAPDGRGVSYFMLRNDHWQFLGLDTAWEIHGLGMSGYLNDAQAKWAKTCVQPAGGLRTILLSHHQYFSAHHGVGGNLPKRLKPVIDGPRGVDAWFWGHEHICSRFASNKKKVRYAACVGHGAIPHAVDNVVPAQGEWEYDDGYTDADGDRWRWCGFAVLDLNGDKIDVRYIDEQGNAHHPEQLPV